MKFTKYITKNKKKTYKIQSEIFFLSQTKEIFNVCSLSTEYNHCNFQLN